MRQLNFGVVCINSVINKTENTRNYGVDLLRIVSMYMVVVLHVLGQGGALQEAMSPSLQYQSAWFLKILCFGAVNCYALISGYVGINSRYRYSSIAYLWLWVFFYSAGFAFIAAYLSPKIKMDAFIDGLTPVSSLDYWYFTAYFCMFFFIPLFNIILNTLSNKQLYFIASAIFILFSVMTVFSEKDLFNTYGGYSALWLSLCYILGGIFKRTNLLFKIKPWLGMLLFLVCVIATWLERYAVRSFNLHHRRTSR